MIKLGVGPSQRISSPWRGHAGTGVLIPRQNYD
jgi:hypothetical protein